MAYKARIQDEDGLSQYLGNVGNHHILTREEEVDLFQKVEAGDSAARELIARSNLRFVVKVALQYKGFGVPVADLIQEGNLGLLLAIDKFDWRRGFRFSTYSAYYIRQEIQTAIHRQGSMIRLPIRKARLLNKINELVRNYQERDGREPELAELAAELALPVETIEPVMSLRHTFASLEEERNEEGASLLDMIPSEATPAPSAALEVAQTRDAVDEALAFLSEREQQVVELRFGLKSGRSYSLRGASKVIGLSQEGVRRVETRALDKLRRPAMRARLEDLLSA